jgi:M6 family metalloprotease-like protein
MMPRSRDRERVPGRCFGVESQQNVNAPIGRDERAALQRRPWNGLATGVKMKWSVGVVVAGAALALQSDAVLVAPETVKSGCAGDTFFAQGNAWSGKFFRGPNGMAFCGSSRAMFFLIDGACSAEEITCSRRAPSTGAARAKAAPKAGQQERELSGKTYLSEAQAARQSGRGRPPAQLKNLVLMLKFNDTDLSTLPTKERFERLFNEVGLVRDNVTIFTESVRTLYRQMSSGRLDIESVLSGWVEVPMSKADVSGGCVPRTNTSAPDPNDKDGLDCCRGTCPRGKVQVAITKALALLEQRVGADFFKQFDANSDGIVDMFTVVQSGDGAESTGAEGVLGKDIWSHKYYLAAANWTAADETCGQIEDEDKYLECSAFQLQSGLKFNNYNINPARWFVGNYSYMEPGVRISRIGVFSHEMGHFLGLPDYYDTDSSSYGLHNFCLMANSWGIDGSQNYPPQMSAPSKFQLGWIDTVDLLADAARNQTFKGTFALEAVQTTPQGYTIALGDSQYFIIENRQPLKTDMLMLGGILVYHVDMAAPRRDGARTNQDEFNVNNQTSWAITHPQVRLVQPDGLYDLEDWRKNSARNKGERYGAGDSGDWFPFFNATTGKQVELADNEWMLPNINRYANLGKPSYLRLFNFSSKGPNMTFSFEYNPPPTAQPTAQPTVQPTAEPTAAAAPTLTPAPTAAAAPTLTPKPAASAGVLVAAIIGGLAATAALMWCGINKFKPETDAAPGFAVATYSNRKVDTEAPQL